MIRKQTEMLLTGSYEREVWVRAHRMLSRHGDDAAILACMMADAEFVQGRMKGYETFKRVAAAIEDLLSNKPRAVRDIH